MKFRIGNLVIRTGFPFFASATLFLSSGMAYNYLCCLLFSSLHEIGHIIPMLAFGCDIKEISFGGMGIKIEKSSAILSYHQECVVALCGPFINLILAVLLFFFKNKSEFLHTAFNINIGLFVINLLPIVMLDGGRFLKYFLLNFLSEEYVHKILNIVEMSVSVILIAVLIVTLIFNIVSEYFVFFIMCIVGMTVFSIISQK